MTTTYPKGSNAWLVMQLEEVNRIIDLMERQYQWLSAREEQGLLEAPEYQEAMRKTVATLERYCKAWDEFVEGGGTDG